MGLGQQSSAAPILATNTYKPLGHGFNSKSSISRPHRSSFLLQSSTLMTRTSDVINCGDCYGISDDNFHQKIQHATNDLGELVEATGSVLKREKSFYYLLLWKFSRDVAKLKSFYKSFPQHKCSSHTGSNPVPIPLMDASHTTKTLGVWINPLCNPPSHCPSSRTRGWTGSTA
jgi:hypothetical protein